MADRRKKKYSVQTTNEKISADDIKAKLRRIHYLDINPNSLDKLIKVQMAELNIDKKEDLTNTKIHLILDKVIEKSKLDYTERQAALEKINGNQSNRFVDESQDEAINKDHKNDNPEIINNENQQVPLKNININSENNNNSINARIDNDINDNRRNNENRYVSNTNNEQQHNSEINNNDRDIHQQNINNTNEEENKKENRYISNIDNADNIGNINFGNEPNNNETLSTELEKNQNRNENRIDVHDISEARAKREGSRYIAEELSKVLTSIVADDENIEKIGNSINALKDSNDKNKKKINVNKFIDNL